MHWPVLILSGVLEAVWAVALGLSDGFTVFWPTVVFLVAGVASMVGLAYAMRGIPVGTAYAVWTGLGAALTVVYSTVFGGESASVLKLLFLAGIVGCVIGLKLVHSREEHAAEAHHDLPVPDEPPGA
nr:multidrug efflux SMR transporter [Agromyces sp. Marseille-P2726]